MTVLKIKNNDHSKLLTSLGILPHGMPEVRDVKPALTKHEQAEEEQKKRDEINRQRISDLSEEEKMVSFSQRFMLFLFSYFSFFNIGHNDVRRLSQVY